MDPQVKAEAKASNPFVKPRSPARESPGTINSFSWKWADEITVNEEFPIGGSLTSDIKTLVKLDFNNLITANPDSIKEKQKAFEIKVNDQYTEFLRQHEINDLPASLYSALVWVQASTNKVLAVNDSKDHSIEREEKFRSDLGNKGAVLLSKLRGISACAERALVAKHLLDTVGIKNVYLGGLWNAHNIRHSPTEICSAHSFLVLDFNNKSYIFDVAREKSCGLPRILEAAILISEELFKNRSGVLVECRDIISDQKSYFGAGHILSQHKFEVITG